MTQDQLNDIWALCQDSEGHGWNYGTNERGKANEEDWLKRQSAPHDLWTRRKGGAWKEAEAMQQPMK